MAETCEPLKILARLIHTASAKVKKIGRPLGYSEKNRSTDLTKIQSSNEALIGCGACDRCRSGREKLLSFRAHSL